MTDGPAALRANLHEVMNISASLLNASRYPHFKLTSLVEYRASFDGPLKPRAYNSGWRTERAESVRIICRPAIFL